MLVYWEILSPIEEKNKTLKIIILIVFPLLVLNRF